MIHMLDLKISQEIARGQIIPAHPLALTAERRLDERRQRALTRYYIAAGADGLAVGVHTTQFAIRDAQFGLYEPVLKLAVDEMNRADLTRPVPLTRIGGICGDIAQAMREAQLLANLGYHAGLLNLSELTAASDEALLSHCRTIADVIPIVGFYMQPSIGGRVLSFRFWRQFAEIENVVAIKIAPFDRYKTIDVIRAVCESGRSIPLYTGNDDNIVVDLRTPYVFSAGGEQRELRMVGGLLGHWAVWTKCAVELFRKCREVACGAESISTSVLRRSVEVTDANAAFFDAANNFSGCNAGLREVLRRQGLLEGIWCLDASETLSPGQKEEIDRVYAAYPHLNDDEFVKQGLDEWLTP